jgi:hypothetical protein
MACQFLVGSLDCDNGHIFHQLLRQLMILAEPLKEFANATFDMKISNKTEPNSTMLVCKEG